MRQRTGTERGRSTTAGNGGPGPGSGARGAAPYSDTRETLPGDGARETTPYGDDTRRAAPYGDTRLAAPHGDTRQAAPHGDARPAAPHGDARQPAPYGGAGGAAPRAGNTPAHPAAPRILDLRGSAPYAPRRLRFAEGDLVAVSGLPGSGKSTLLTRLAAARTLDSQETRERWAARLPALPYALYRPLVRLDHYRVLLRAALAPHESLLVHDCGTLPFVRALLALAARRRGTRFHLLFLDVPPPLARAGQRTRGREVSRYAFARHRRAAGRLRARAARGLLPRGCARLVLLDREAATALAGLDFVPRGETGTLPAPRGAVDD